MLFKNARSSNQSIFKLQETLLLIMEHLKTVQNFRVPQLKLQIFQLDRVFFVDAQT